MAISKSGIYKIINKLNNQIYIGSSIHINRRLNEHKSSLKNNKHYNKFLQNSYNKYGKEHFDFKILEECDNLLEREQYYIDTLKPTYNLLPLAYRTEGIKRSNETKHKQSIARLGMKFTNEHKNNISLGKLGKTYNTGNRIKSIFQYDKCNNLIKNYNSIMQASRETNIKRTSISNCCNGLSQTAGGYKWRFTND